MEVSALLPVPAEGSVARAPARGERIGSPEAVRHPRLRQQLAGLGLDGDAPSAELWKALLDEVSATYTASDAERAAAEGSPSSSAPAAPPTTEQTKLSAVIGSLGEGLLVLDDELRVESINRQGEQILRTSAQEMIGRPIDELARTWSLRDRGPYAVSKMRHHLLRGIPYRNDDAFVVGDDGSIIHVSLVMTPTESAGQRLGAVICFRDVTTLKTTERRLRQSERRFRRIFEGAPTGMIRIAGDGTVAESNAAFQGLLGLDDKALAGAHLADLSHPEDVHLARQLLEGLFGAMDAGWQGQWRFVRADGQTAWTTTSLALVDSGEEDESFAIAVVEDESERRRLEVELRHAQKLEAVGRLAAGIAHEINTPIQFIGDNVHFIGEAFETMRRTTEAGAPPAADPDLQFLVDEVPLAVRQTLDGVERVAGIVRAMKSFGRPDIGQRSPADLNEAVRSTIIVARNELKYVADVVTDLGDLPAVPCFLGDVNQVLLNLLINAAHAIEDVESSTSRGTITVTTRCRDEGVELAVTDTGTGVPEGIRHRLFDPFFTTKAVGKGTGQGLALARSIVVERHGGQLTFDSELGSGTTFRVWLPLRPT